MEGSAKVDESRQWNAVVWSFCDITGSGGPGDTLSLRWSLIERGPADVYLQLSYQCLALLGLIGITVSRIHRLYELFGDLSGLYRICCINSSNEHPRGFNPRGLDFYNFLSEVFRGLECWLIEDHVLHKDITPISTSPSQITHGHQSNCLFLLYVYLKANCNVLSDEYWGGF